MTEERQVIVMVGTALVGGLFFAFLIVLALWLNP